MNNGWWDGYEDAFDDLEQPKQHTQFDKPQQQPGKATKNQPQPQTESSIITCQHCHSTKLKLRNSSRDHTEVTFTCIACNKQTRIDLPYGYERVYRKIT